MTHNVLCTVNSFTPQAEEILNKTCNLTIGDPTPERLAEADVLLVQLGVHVNKELMDAAPKLKVIATATTGLDHIDTAYAAYKGIRVLSLKEEIAFLRTVTSTAELALGLMFAVLRKIPAAHQSVIAGNWDREAFRGHAVHGKTLGIVGLGRLGEMMQRYGEALGMRVIYTDPFKEGSTPLEELLQEADVVTLHVHLSEETENMIGAEQLALMKPSAVLINTARAQLVDEDAIIKALETGTLAGYGTDEQQNELSFTPTHAKSAMIDYAKTHDNIIIMPHTGGTTVEAREATDVFMAERIVQALQG